MTYEIGTKVRVFNKYSGQLGSTVYEITKIDGDGVCLREYQKQKYNERFAYIRDIRRA